MVNSQSRVQRRLAHKLDVQIKMPSERANIGQEVHFGRSSPSDLLHQFGRWCWLCDADWREDLSTFVYSAERDHCDETALRRSQP
jgi:hypothetical protein